MTHRKPKLNKELPLGEAIKDRVEVFGGAGIEISGIEYPSGTKVSSRKLLRFRLNLIESLYMMRMIRTIKFL